MYFVFFYLYHMICVSFGATKKTNIPVHFTANLLITLNMNSIPGDFETIHYYRDNYYSVTKKIFQV